MKLQQLMDDARARLYEAVSGRNPLLAQQALCRHRLRIRHHSGHRLEDCQDLWHLSPPRPQTEESTTDEGGVSVCPRLFPESRKANRALVDVMAAFAAQRNATTAQIALAWLLAQKPWIVPIPGTTKMERLEENIGAAALELTPEELRELDDATAKIAVVGARYPEALERMTNL